MQKIIFDLDTNDYQLVCSNDRQQIALEQKARVMLQALSDKPKARKIISFACKLIFIVLGILIILL